MTKATETGRRDVLKATGGLATVAALGTLPAIGAAEHVVDDSPIRVNQVGYLPTAPKMAVVLEDVSTFELQDATTGETVYEGSVSEPTDDEASGQTVRHADFSDVTEPGEYVVAVEGGTSHSFEIGEDIYDDVLATMGRLLTLKRAATRVEDPVTGLSIGPGHTQDEQAMMAAPDDEFYDQGEPLDVSGGWYDAGDYGKYVTPSAITVGSLLLAYERNPEAFDVGQFQIPDSVDDPHVGEMPDVLVECRQKLEWFEKMQRPDGGLYYIVAGDDWPDMDVRPENDDMERYVFGLSSAGTAMAAANFAQAARLYEEYDPDFADRMLENAEDAFGFLEDNPDVVWREDPDQDEGSGPYTRDSSDDGDRFWAAAELLKTTGDDRYAEYLETEQAVLFTRDPVQYDWLSGFTFGQWAYLTADAADPDRKVQIENEIVGWADDVVDDIEEDGYNNAIQNYVWGSVKNGAGKGHILLLASEITNDETYAEAALDQVHHVFGRSATGFSYVTEVGDLTPENPHDRIVESTGTVLPGMVVGGPNDGAYQEGEYDDTSDYIDGDTPPALSYVDVTGSYSTNEWAINYSAPVVLMVAEVVGWDGEDERETTIEVGDYETRDTTADGLHNDFTGDGQTTHDDVTAFFENLEDEAVRNNTDAFDFAENDRVGFADVVDLLRRV